MPFLVRKVEKSKWKPGETQTFANVPSDAITRDMMTTSCTLSVWQISLDDEEEIADEGILALVTNERQTCIETIDVALLDLSELENNNLARLLPFYIITLPDSGSPAVSSLILAIVF